MPFLDAHSQSRANGWKSRLTGSRLAADKRGNIAMIFTIALLPLCGFIGASVDYARALNLKSEMQTALDAAVLAGGREYQVTGSASDAQARVVAHFNVAFANASQHSAQPVLSAPVVNLSASTITASASAAVPTPFLAVLQMPTVTVNALSKSGLTMGGANTEKDIEVSMMLDVTGSMSGQKLADMKLAAKDLVDIMLPTGYTGTHTARIALVPFSQYVNVGSYYQDVTGVAPSGSDTCVTERQGSHAYDDHKPNSGDMIGTFTPHSNHGWWSTDCQPSAEIMPLSSDKTALKASIDGYNANGWTAGHIGTAWAWYMLSHDWVDVWPAGSKPAANNPANVMKVAVLMTDGDFNTYYHNGDSQTQAENLCSNMKNDNIIVYTIGFQVSPGAESFLQGCATSSAHYFNATNGDQLRQAFRTIAFTLSQLRLTQ